MEKRYVYHGPVMYFGRCIDSDWIGSTWASSEKKARSNFAYQYKKLCGFSANAKISLPGKIQTT